MPHKDLESIQIFERFAIIQVDENSIDGHTTFENMFKRWSQKCKMHI